jgi:hypothetical protein
MAKGEDSPVGDLALPKAAAVGHLARKEDVVDQTESFPVGE